MAVSTERLARELLEVVPQVTSAIRAELRRHQEGSLSLAEYRVLVYLRSRRDVSLSALAEHIGLGLPSMSKMVDRLVDRGLISRMEASHDRRRLALCLTEAGAITVEEALAATQQALARAAGVLDAGQRETVSQALTLMRSLFMRDECASGAGSVLINPGVEEIRRGGHGVRNEGTRAEQRA